MATRAPLLSGSTLYCAKSKVFFCSFFNGGCVKTIKTTTTLKTIIAYREDAEENEQPHVVRCIHSTSRERARSGKWGRDEGNMDKENREIQLSRIRYVNVYILLILSVTQNQIFAEYLFDQVRFWCRSLAEESSSLCGERSHRHGRLLEFSLLNN